MAPKKGDLPDLYTFPDKETMSSLLDGKELKSFIIYSGILDLHNKSMDNREIIVAVEKIIRDYGYIYNNYHTRNIIRLLFKDSDKILTQ